MSDSATPARTSGDGADSSWIEVTDPLADAMQALAACIHEAPNDLKGASIAVTERGTLLLNERAWEICGSALRELPGLKTLPVRLEDARPIRFLLADALRVP